MKTSRRETMNTILNWKGERIQVVSSKGGTLAVVNPQDNLLHTITTLWPSPEITQKLYQSRQVRAFEGSVLAGATQTLGYYSDLQSLHSEDAMTWSMFGPLLHDHPATRSKYVDALFSLLGIPVSPTHTANIWLWRRVPHPDTLGLGGPEIDFGIHTEQVMLFGEAKWLSGEGQGQGKSREKSQITLRREFFEKYGSRVFPSASHYVVLGVSLSGGMLPENTTDLGTAKLHLRDTTWDALCDLTPHPSRSELQAYLQWKKNHSKLR